MTAPCQGCTRDGYTGTCTVEPTTLNRLPRTLADREITEEMAYLHDAIHRDLQSPPFYPLGSAEPEISPDAQARQDRQDALYAEIRDRCPIGAEFDTYLSLRDIDALIALVRSDRGSSKRLERLERIRLALQFNNAAHVSLYVAE